MLLYGLAALIYAIGCLTGELFGADQSLSSKVLAPVLPTLFVWYLAKRLGWVAVLLQLGILAFMVARMAGVA